MSSLPVIERLNIFKYGMQRIDTYSSVGFAKLYTAKIPVTAADILNNRVFCWNCSAFSSITYNSQPTPDDFTEKAPVEDFVASPVSGYNRKKTPCPIDGLF